MRGLKVYERRSIDSMIARRSGEVKLGEKLSFISDFSEIKAAEASFVLFGIPEDIGIRANYGKPGASGAWKSFLQAFLNAQHNRYTSKKEILLLGEIDTSAVMAKAAAIDFSDPNYHLKLGDIVSQIDKVVSAVMQGIIEAGKVPVVVGGGHNNAYGNLKGSSSALGKQLHAINIDAHTDFRTPSYRHSGNGFSFAKKEGFLRRYVAFAIHENYTPEYIFKTFEENPDLKYHLLEELTCGNLMEKFEHAIAFVEQDAFGLEVDCDGIANFPSSAVSPAGLSLNSLRMLIKRIAVKKNCTYLHLCEAANAPHFNTGKALAYLVSDFIKERSNEGADH